LASRQVPSPVPPKQTTPSYSEPMTASEAFEVVITNGRGGGDPRSPSWSRVCEKDAWNAQLGQIGANYIDRCGQVHDLLHIAKAQVLVIGHCPNIPERNPRSDCGGKLILADTWMSRGYNQRFKEHFEDEPDKRLWAMRFSQTADDVKITQVSLSGEFAWESKS